MSQISLCPRAEEPVCATRPLCVSLGQSYDISKMIGGFQKLAVQLEVIAKVDESQPVFVFVAGGRVGIGSDPRRLRVVIRGLPIASALVRSFATAARSARCSAAERRFCVAGASIPSEPARSHNSALAR
jgi:hypothetical protein